MTLKASELQIRKQKLEEKLHSYGIISYPISYIRYVDESEETFAEPEEVGKRIMILYSIVYTVNNRDQKKPVKDWLISQNIWDSVSDNEKVYFETEIIDEDVLIDLSWKFEAAYILAWTLGIVKELPSPLNQVTDEQSDDFVNSVPALGDDLSLFLSDLRFINKSEIYLENLFHELATTYFRDLLFSGKKDETEIDRNASFERHKALNWVRRFMDSDDWDNIDTST